MVRIGTYAAVALAGAGVAVAKTSMDFEDAFATVEKTVEGTPQALDAIDQGLRKLSTSIPVTFQELTSIASEAGALGVKTKDIENFTEAVARTSAATVGLDPFMASEAFGKLSTIFTLTGDHVDKTTGKIVSDYERLGSALVALGNAGASSEAEIIDVTKYFAGAGQQAGLSAAQVLAWGSALTSLGMQPEAGGGALQRVFQRLTTNIGIGTDASKVKVAEWARVSGMAVKDFTRLFRDDASQAVITFLGGLQKLDKFQAAKALTTAGIVNQRDIRAVITLSQHIPVLTDQLKISTDAWEENTALMEVSEKRFDTLKSHVKELGNDVKVGAAAIGDGMNPALDRLSQKAKAFLDLHMQDLSDLGRDIGNAIDDIDWTKVMSGAQTVVDITKNILAIVEKIPPQILAGAAAFGVLNRLSGGLLGAGAGNIAGGLIGMVGTIARGALLSVLPPALRGPLAAATVMHVWVDNMPLGGIGIPGAIGGAAATAAGIGVGTVAVAAAAAIGTALLIAGAEQESQTDRGKAVIAAHAQSGHWGAGYVNPTPRNPVDMSPEARQERSDLHALALSALVDQRRGEHEGRSEAGNMAARGLGNVQSPMLPALTAAAIAAAFRGVFPDFTSEQRSGALERGRAAGYKPRGGAGGEAVTATLQRDFIRAATAQKNATDNTTTAVHGTTAAVERGSGGATLNLSLTIPPVKNYVQEIHKTFHYGPMVPNGPRNHFNGGGV